MQVRKLAENKRFTLVVWPDHCLLGSSGHAVVPKLHTSLMSWVDARSRAVEYVLKGNNVLTEHYSAMQADVLRDDDPRTLFNNTVFQRLRKSDRVIICGQALSHCVAFTTRDLVNHWPEGERQKLVLLTDCASPGAWGRGPRTPLHHTSVFAPGLACRCTHGADVPPAAAVVWLLVLRCVTAGQFLGSRKLPRSS